MPPEETELWASAQQAQDKLAQQLLSHPEVSLIDIACEPESEGRFSKLVLRVHLRQLAAGQAPAIPEELDGIPVRVVFGDYRIE
jgi:hypothetical protein